MPVLTEVIGRKFAALVVGIIANFIAVQFIPDGVDRAAFTQHITELCAMFLGAQGTVDVVKTLKGGAK